MRKQRDSQNTRCGRCALPWLRRGEAVSGLRRLGVRRGGLLLVHSSLSALGYVPGGPAEVVNVLFEALGRHGTLVLPTHTWQWMNGGCRVFDVAETPSCVGKITEFFRNMPAVERSLHPTHSVAALGTAEELTFGHELAATPCGPGTPYEKILDGGQILLLGVGLESNTAFHSIEAICQVDYLMQKDPEVFTIVDSSRKSRKMSIRRHANGIPRRFPALQPLLERPVVLRCGRVGPADSMLLEGAAFRDAMVDLLRENPACLLEESSMRERSLLMISYAFPPSSLAGVFRTLRFVKYLPEFGWKPLVLATAPEAFNPEWDDPTLELSIPAGTFVERTKVYSPVLALEKMAHSFQTWRKNGRIAKSIGKHARRHRKPPLHKRPVRAN